MNLRNRLSSGEDEMHVSALNDILFILLFFFLIISTLANPNIIPVRMPKMKTGQKSKQSIVVSIDSTQKIFIGTRPVLADSLLPAINAMVLKHPQDTATVVINADRKATAENIVAVMRAARDCKLKAVMAVENK